MATEAGGPVRIVVAGAGLIGQAHIARVRREPEACLAGIVDADARVSAQAAELGVPFASSIQEMLGAVPVDGVVIALPNQVHLTAGLAAARAGVAMLMEKPVCETVEQAIELAEVAERAGVPVLVGHHRRHSTTMRRAKAVVESGRLGRITAVNAFAWLLKPPEYFEGRNAWRREAGGGPVMINLVHTMDDLRNLCGDIASVQAMTSNERRGFAVEDTAGVILRFRNGAIGTIALSDTAAGPWSWELTSGENAAYPRTQESCYFIAGTEGALAIPRLELWHHGEKGHWWSPIEREAVDEGMLLGGDDPLANQMRHFCNVARGMAGPLLDARGGTETLRATLAVLEAARTGRSVDLI